MMTIALTQALIPAHPTNRVFDPDPPLRKRPIETHILRRPIFPARFAARCRPHVLRMRLGNADVGQVADGSDPLAQAREQARLLQQRQIRSGSPPKHPA
jgi:hypothetical protein